MDDARIRLIKCFAAVFPDLTEAEIFRASLNSVANWDSTATITLITLIEEEFGIQIEPDGLENLVSYELILDYIRGKMGVA